MARTNTSVGMGITVTLMGVMLLATFILAIVFYGKKQRAEEDYRRTVAENNAFIDVGERAQFADLLAEAQRNGDSLVAYLNRISQDSLRHLTGSSQVTSVDLQLIDERLTDSGANSLVGLLDKRESRIVSLQDELAKAEAARRRAETDRDREVSRIGEIENERSTTIAALNDEIGRYKSENDRYRAQVGDTIEANNGRVEQIRSEAAQTEAGLRDQLADLNERLLIQQDELKRLKAQNASDTLRPTDEYALVDSLVVATDAPQRQVYIDIGRDSRVVLGMTFEVYSNAAAIQPDDSGNYPRGKATVEVIRIEDNSSVCRIIRENRGNPIVVGDVLANALFDPNKTYTFVVFGNFDAQRNGVATPQERNEILGLIRQWGGEIAEDMTGNVDFLVLGQRPVLPPAPPPDAPLVVIQEYLRKQRDAQEYDRLFNIAQQTSIPVLNENRLYTLIGR